MRKLFNIIRSGAFVLGLLSLPSPTAAQIQRYNATAENDYGVVYTLPQTEYIVTATVLHKQFTPGELAPWSAKYLGKEASVQERHHHQLLDIRVETIGVADSTKRYVVAFDKRTIAPFVGLMPNGVLYSINGTTEPEPARAAFVPPSYPQPDRQMPALPREYSLAISKSKRAELAATYLYEVREHAMSIVSGSVEQMPKDGESMRLILDKLKTEEQRCLRLFEGDTVYNVKRVSYRIVPEQADMNGRLLFRLSEQWGIVPDNDLSGDPVTYELRILERSPELDPKERAKRDKLDGIIYNLPGMAELNITYQGNSILRERLPITQVGTIQSLSKKMFNIKEGGTTAVYLDPRSGALLRVTNE
ncbi:MAG: DUF4831 family protein [Porphyromonas sp.]|nr:DUF4831 family protein [Porphyromonas sp.]